MSLVASFWTLHAASTWPPVAVVFAVVIAVVLYTAWKDHKANYIEEPHYHVVRGAPQACYHACKQQNLFFSKMYWISLTLAFPIEHIVYHKLWPFYLLSNWLNIG
jgi:hypothetical protein